jgi:hypothetical protein
MEITNERLLEGARNLKSKGYSPEQVDAWLQTKGSSLDAMKTFASQPKEPSTLNISDEAKAQIAKNQEEYNKPNWANRGKVALAFTTGALGGIDNALNRAVNSMTLGAYNKLSQLTGGNEYLQDKEIRERNKAEGLGLADTLAGLAVELPANIATTGSAIYNLLGKTGAKEAAKVIGSGAIEGALGNAIQSEKFKDAPLNAFGGGVVGAGLSAIPLGGAKAYDFLKTVVKPKQDSFKRAIERIYDIAGGEEKIVKAAQDAAVRGRSALEVGSREIAQAADSARLNSKEANQMLNTFVDAERAAKADANRKVINDVFGERTKAQNTDAIIEKTKELATPIYENLTKRGALSSEELNDIVRNNDFVRKEIGKVRADTTFERAIREAPDNDFRVLDAVKRNVDDQIEVAKRAGKNDEVLRLQKQKMSLLDAMDKVAPEYKQARQLYEAKGKVLSAQKIGETAMDGKVTAETLGRKMREMSPAERQAVGIGMKENVLSNLGSKENEALALRQLLNKNNQDKLRLALGRRQANNLIDYAKDEVNAYRNFNEALKGSQTAERMKQAQASNMIDLLGRVLKNPLGVVGEVADYAAAPAANEANKAMVELLTDKGGDKIRKAISDKVVKDAEADIRARMLAAIGAEAGSNF